MNQIWTLTKKELRSYFNSPLAYIFMTVFLVLSSWLFFRNFFIQGVADMRGFFALVPWMFLFLIPAITMRLWSEEKKLGTIEILLTLPISDAAVVLGKFFASLIFLALTLASSLVLAIVVAWAGPTDWGVIIASYLGSLLLGGAYIALGMWFSAFTDNQIIAFLMAIVVSFFFFIVGEPLVLDKVPHFMAEILKFFGLGSHFQSIARGVIDSRDILFYLSFIGFFLFLNAQQIAGRRFK